LKPVLIIQITEYTLCSSFLRRWEPGQSAK
jgi:hypothetical protein